MRGVLLLVTFAGMLPVAWIIPHVGVLLWCWVAYMNPHTLVYGATDFLRLNLTIAIVTVTGWVFSNSSKKIPMNSTTILLIILSVLLTISSYLSLTPEPSWYLWDRHIKTFFLMFMIIAIVNNRVRIHALIWVTAISIGFYAVQGGLVGLVSGGTSKFVGPPGTMISDNNHLALAMVITLPLMNYLRIQSANKLVQLILLSSMALTVVGVLTTYSRGGFIGLAAMMAFLWLKSSRKLVVLLFALLVFVPAIQFMPREWTERMDTIETASEEDSSFQSRLRAWETSFNLAVARPFVGGGLSAIQTKRVYQKYKPDGDRTVARAAHSIYFQVLGDMGFVGLAIYLLIYLVAWRNASIVIRLSRRRRGSEWARNLAAMLQVSLVGYLVTGAALSMAYYDVSLMFAAVLSVLRHLMEQREGALADRSVDALSGAGRRPKASATV